MLLSDHLGLLLVLPVAAVVRVILWLPQVPFLVLYDLAEVVNELVLLLDWILIWPLVLYYFTLGHSHSHKVVHEGHNFRRDILLRRIERRLVHILAHLQPIVNLAAVGLVWPDILSVVLQALSLVRMASVPFVVGHALAQLDHQVVTCVDLIVLVRKHVTV